MILNCQHCNKEVERTNWIKKVTCFDCGQKQQKLYNDKVKESERTTLFLKWAKARKNETFVAEAKISKGNSLPFNAVKPHQEAALYAASHGLMNYKISDFSPEQKPFDLFQVHRVPAYVVIFWYIKNRDKRMSLIPIDNWLKEKETSNRQSLTYERSCEIGRCEEL